MPPLPAWLTAHLADTGALTGRAVRHTRCTKCARHVIQGFDGDRCGLLAICDPTEIDTRGELVALALGLRSYTLTRCGGAWNLDPRYPTAIEAGQRTPLVAQHRCGLAIPPAATSRLPARPRRQLAAAPPF